MPFSPIARFYDHDDGLLQEDIPTILAFAEQTGGPVLDLGAGTGRLSLPLAQAGYQVTGVDSSAPMLAIARNRIKKVGLETKVELIEADFRFLQLEQQFGLAYCGYNSFLHLIDTEEQLAALRSWRLHLAADGMLVIDVLNPYLEPFVAADGSLILDEQWRDAETGHLIQKLYACTVDLSAQVYTINRFYDETDNEGVLHRTSVQFETRILFRRELALLLQLAGFNDLHFFGDHDLTPWHEESPRIIVAARL